MSKLTQTINGTITSLSAQDLAGAKEIRKDAFRNYDTLRSIEFPLSIYNVNEYAFELCNNLRDITILNETNIIPSSVLLSDKNRNIYVPYNLLSQYLNDDNYNISIKGFKKYFTGEVLQGGAIWYPTKADLVAETNGIEANGSNVASSTGTWYVDATKNILTSSTTVNFSRPSSSTVSYETNSTNAIEAGDYSAYNNIGVLLSYTSYGIKTQLVKKSIILENNITFNGVTYKYGKVIETSSYSSLFIGFNDNSSQFTIAETKRKYFAFYYYYSNIDILAVKLFEN